MAISANPAYSSGVAAPRRNSVRGSLVRGQSARAPKTAAPGAPEHVADPTKPRSVIDYGLQRRSALSALRTRMSEPDADPILLRTARHHGEPAERDCPACRDAGLVEVTYVYGDELGPFSGRVRSAAELPAMATSFGAFTVYVVEVCCRCEWNFLARTYVLGDGVPRRPLAAPRDLMEA
jgi:hypothetical protein